MVNKRTCSGASQVGKLPAKCSIKTPQKRSMEPKGARWMRTGRCGLLSAPMYCRSETLRQVIIDLHGAQLPLAANHIAHHEIDFGAVKGGFTDFLGEWHTHAFGHFQQYAFSFAQFWGLPAYLSESASRSPTRTR